MTPDSLKIKNLDLPVKSQSASIILMAKDIRHTYDGTNYVLNGIDLEIAEGEFIMILGRSGTGKSTLIKILAQLIKPTSGEVRVLRNKDCSLCSRGVAYIPQNLGLVRSLTVMDNVLMGLLGQTGTIASMFNQFTRESREKAQRIIADLGLDDKRDKRVWHLSGGERQRVAIARALIQDPRLILADEFVSQLDPVTSMEILAMMRKVAQNKSAFLTTTHDVALVRKYADQVIIMRHGKIFHKHTMKDCLVENMLEEMR